MMLPVFIRAFRGQSAPRISSLASTVGARNPSCKPWLMTQMNCGRTPYVSSLRYLSAGTKDEKASSKLGDSEGAGKTEDREMEDSSDFGSSAFFLPPKDGPVEYADHWEEVHPSFARRDPNLPFSEKEQKVLDRANALEEEEQREQEMEQEMDESTPPMYKGAIQVSPDDLDGGWSREEPTPIQLLRHDLESVVDATNDDPEGINQLRNTHVAELVGTFNAFDLREKDKINRTMESKEKSEEWGDKINISVLLKIGRHVKITKGGKVRSHSAVVLVGDGNGTAGYGYGKAETVDRAVENAHRDAMRHLITIDRYDDRTISYPLDIKSRATRLQIKPRPANSGVTSSRLLRKIFGCFGIKDVTAKTYGSRNIHNILRVVFQAVQYSESRELIAKKLGRRSFDLHRIFRSRETLRAY